MHEIRIGLFALYLTLTPHSVVAQDLVEAWFDLWSRCRIAIETRQELEVHDLLPASFLIDPSVHPYDHSGYAYRAWARDDGQFLVVEGEWTEGEQVRRVCDVVPIDGMSSLTDIEEAMIIRSFLIERWRLVVSGSHEVRNPDPVFEIGLGVGPVVENPNGCSVISVLMIDLPSGFFESGSGEQNRSGCGGPSLLD